MTIRGITFDFWDTIVDDDTDEPKRAERGLPSKAVARRNTFVDEILAHHPAVGCDAAVAAFDHAQAASVTTGRSSTTPRASPID